MSEVRKPLILVTNDDGIYAPGIRHLISVMEEFGELFVIAPDKPQSGMGHAITIQTPLRVKRLIANGKYMEYSCNGTPVDCVKLAEHSLLLRKPDLLVSGINHGSNSSVNIIYSGTMAAVLEGVMGGIPSIGFSLLDYSHDADFSHTSPFIQSIVASVLKDGLPYGVGLNVNFPKNDGVNLKGIKVCRQANACWVEEFDARTDPHHRDYYWLTGYFKNSDEGEDTDEWALSNRYVSLVPVHYDFTAHTMLDEFKQRFHDETDQA
jgi:5'-nucleotidase